MKKEIRAQRAIELAVNFANPRLPYEQVITSSIPMRNNGNTQFALDLGQYGTDGPQISYLWSEIAERLHEAGVITEAPPQLQQLQRGFQREYTKHLTSELTLTVAEVRNTPRSSDPKIQTPTLSAEFGNDPKPVQITLVVTSPLKRAQIADALAFDPPPFMRNEYNSLVEKLNRDRHSLGPYNTPTFD